jgi:hypothetical protein
LLGASINGKLYASQGQLPGFKPAGLVYEYDPAGDKRTEKKPMPHPIHHSAVTVLNGKMYPHISAVGRTPLARTVNNSSALKAETPKWLTPNSR